MLKNPLQSKHHTNGDMKVLYFHQHFCTPSGANGIRSYAMSQHLIERGHSVTMVCGSYVSADTGLRGEFRNGIRRGVVDGIDVIEMDLRYGNSDSFYKRVSTMIRYFYRASLLIFSEKYDLIFATSTPLTAGIPGIIGSWFIRKPFIFEVRDLWPEIPRQMGIIKNPIFLFLMSLLEYITYKSARHIIALSPGIAKGIEKKNISKESITLIPNGCDMDIVENINTRWLPKSLKRDDFIALFAGTHGPANGLFDVLAAAEELKKRRRNDIKILLVGEGKHKKSLIKNAKNKNLDNIIFHEYVPKAKLFELMNSVDIGLQTLADIPAFYYGTSPNKFFDYISAGLPVINNYPGWLAEIIKENNCGYIVKPGDPIGFANALEAASTNSKLCEMGSNSKDLAINMFNRKVLARKWVDTIEKIYLN